MKYYPTMREVYGRTLVELAKKNKDIVVLDADMIESCALQYFQKEFPARFFNFGIAEQNMMSVAAGMAAYGKIPFVNSFACFLSTKSCDQLRVAVAYTRMNVKIIAGHGGITVGQDGATHQALEDIGIVRSIPNMAVIVPADPVETGEAVKFAVSYKGPVYIRLARPKIEPVSGKNYRFRLGKAAVLREGKDVAIIAIGIMVTEALNAVSILNRAGIDPVVINMSTLKPIDEEILVRTAGRVKAIVTVEDHNIIGGLGSAVAEVLSEKFPIPIIRMGIKDSFGESGTTEELLEKHGLTPYHIARAVKKSLK